MNYGSKVLVFEGVPGTVREDDIISCLRRQDSSVPEAPFFRSLATVRRIIINGALTKVCTHLFVLGLHMKNNEIIYNLISSSLLREILY